MIEAILGTTHYRKQKAARATLNRLVVGGENTLVIHYSCQSFYDPLPGGASPRITSIAVRRFESGQTASFSIHQVAERHGCSTAQIDSRYDEFEKEMLDEFFVFVNRNQNQSWIHWNMRDINYGFAALEHRARVLGCTPIAVSDAQKFDLARMLIDLYGPRYIGNPRLEKLIDKNGITRLAFMTGAEEAIAFEQKNYVALHQSTLRKVDIISNIALRAYGNALKTDSSWWDIHGGSIKGVVDYLAANPLFLVISGAASLIGVILAIIALR